MNNNNKSTTQNTDHFKFDNIKLIIFTHGSLGKEILNVTKIILGDSICSKRKCTIVSLSNKDLSLSTSIKKLRETIDSYIADDKNSKFIIATDFPGGSCFISSKKIENEFKGTVVTISGLNISMVISFVTKVSDKFDNLEQFVTLLKNDGKRAINF